MHPENELKLKTILSDLLERKADELKATSLLKEDLGVDSTEMVELCGALEKAFGIQIDDAVEKRLKTVGDLYSLLSAKA
ncbi:acyl carrier protein [Corallococcus sp. BB11-1]|uniref:acyl carrier protein n=1 Tax=Corallococcus sp. BB11-1 TaxID=2996783 RepID=UPI00226EA8CE|nr:acyl carrier protein [Corallococcus sp. BB11-1]MCY1035381.1 acyl carrier protein [Corallococcus sp. BB11-1]